MLVGEVPADSEGDEGKNRPKAYHIQLQVHGQRHNDLDYSQVEARMQP